MCVCGVLFHRHAKVCTQSVHLLMWLCLFGGLKAKPVCFETVPPLEAQEMPLTQSVECVSGCYVPALADIARFERKRLHL